MMPLHLKNLALREPLYQADTKHSTSKPHCPPQSSKSEGVNPYRFITDLISAIIKALSPSTSRSASAKSELTP
jgi:hypothetical protein